MRVACFLSLVLPLVLCAWPPGTVKRRFYETKRGYIHYVTRGDVQKVPPLILFHGHPCSTEEFVELSRHIPASQPFLALDYFGIGHSDECICDEAKDEFVDYKEFAAYALEICDLEGITSMIPFGTLTGASLALELAGLATEAARSAPARVTKLVLFEPFVLSPKAKAYVDNVYIPSIRHLAYYSNGSHVLDAWLRPDCGPIGPSSPLPVEADLVNNQRKTIDYLVNMRTGWQFKMGWTDYNNDILPRATQLVRAKVETLFIYATAADAKYDKFGLDHTWSEGHLNSTIPESFRTTQRVINGGEGALEQNASLCAGFVRDFLGGWPSAPAPGVPATL